MYKRWLFFKVKLHFQHVHSSFSDQNVFGANMMKDASENKILRNNSYGSSAKEAKIFDCERLERVSPP